MCRSEKDECIAVLNVSSDLCDGLADAIARGMWIYVVGGPHVLVEACSGPLHISAECLGVLDREAERPDQTIGAFIPIGVDADGKDVQLRSHRVGGAGELDRRARGQ